jgi:uncharacterized membrane protein YraQ (UPF0718 family)
MNFQDASKFLWDIIKYVVTAILISTFLGSYKDNTAKLYIMSCSVVTVLAILAIIFYKLSKKE